MTAAVPVPMLQSTTDPASFLPAVFRPAVWTWRGPVVASRFASLTLLLGCCLAAGGAQAESPGGADAEGALDAEVQRFFGEYCLHCHGPETQEADFRVDRLRRSQSASDAEYWKLVLDNLNLGAMPPDGETQPSAEQRERVTGWIDKELRRARRALAGHAREVVLRRLNRIEYEYTIADLFGVRGDFTSGFPADATEEGFETIGAALTLSATQMDAYLQAADEILEQAIETRPRPKTESVTFTLHDLNAEAWENHRQQLERRQRDFDNLTPRQQERTREMLERFKQNPHAGFEFPVVEDGQLRAPTPADGPEVDAVIATRAGYAAPSTRGFFRVREPGWYRFRVVAYGVASDGGPVRLKISHGSFRQGTIATIADVVYLAESKPQAYQYRVFLQPGESIKLEMLDGEKWARREDQVQLPGPFVAIRSMEMEGPLIEQWPPKGHRALLGTRAADSLSDAEMLQVLAEFAPRLFRRPVQTATIDAFTGFYQTARDRGAEPIEAFKLTAKAMMASPHFLYHVEPADGPDEFALANRLSYFLWRSLPDAELRGLADAGRLNDPAELRRQVDRLLDDQKSQRFVQDFTGQWLGIDQVGEMQPDANLYPEYDDELERSMVAETHAFIRELIDEDLKVANLIDSDWAMLNARMAEHYGIEGVRGNQFRRVTLEPERRTRGGLLTHASILNVTSNGTTTSPVVRGVWVMETLLGTPAPRPPPDVPAIEPDIRGASTIQEQLAKHRSIPQCASCHVKIDPYGFGLENFDVIGGWREHYRALEPTANPNRPKLVDGPQVVVADSLPRQGRFEHFDQYRRLLLAEKARVAENVVRQLATFALGRSMTFSDRESLETIVAATGGAEAGMRTVIRELVASDLFRKP